MRRSKDGLLLVERVVLKGHVMEDFTSTFLVNLLQRVVGAVDPELLSGQVMQDPFARATVPAKSKRTLVDRVMDKHGPGLLLSIGQHLPLSEETPIATVFRRSADPEVLADKWMRLERYHHASHRVRIKPLDPQGWACERYSTGSQPTTGENCLVAGLLVGLVGLIGAENCRLQVAGLDIPASDLRNAALPPGVTLETFRIIWAPYQRRQTLEMTAVAETGVGIACQLAGLLAADIGRSWKIGDVAGMLAISTRSLQRHLSAGGRSFSTVLRRVRMREATELLTGTTASLSEIGYCCGYADQAHFQRDFHRVTNITPKRFREVSGSHRSDAKIQ